ncbi:MAG: ATP-binding cassette domain-containing protein [Phycisphaerae bacterium]|jgi:phospholipid/cholesterol/gamma-HCH transport system ATP-binding protein
MSDTEPIIRLKNVTKAFDSRVVLNAVNLNIAPGKITVIIGPSGCGKSVTLKHIVSLIRPDKGKVYFEENEVSAMSERELVPIRRQIGFLFQGAALFDSMTVEENICFPMIEGNGHSLDVARQRCQEVLRVVGLDGAQQKFPEEMSGGEKKRVALARAIVLNPKVILYDEPTTGLDPIRADLINELILKLKNTLGNTALVVTHDMQSTRKIADRVVMLYQGRFIADMTPDHLGDVDNEIVARFVEGRASEEELAQLRTGRLESFNDGPET